MRIWGLGGLGGFIFIVHSIERTAGKLRRIALLQFGPVAFRFNYWEPPKTIICVVLGPGGRDHGSQHQYYLSLETPGHAKTIQENPNYFFEALRSEI